MTEPKTRSPEDDEQPADSAAEGAASSADEGQDEKQGEIARLKDQLLRALAEAENSRRRAQKEREDTAKYAASNFAKEMLGVADNFHRALEAIPADMRGNEALKNLISGIEATGRELQGAFARVRV